MREGRLRGLGSKNGNRDILQTPEISTTSFACAKAGLKKMAGDAYLYSDLSALWRVPAGTRRFAKWKVLECVRRMFTRMEEVVIPLNK